MFDIRVVCVDAKSSPSLPDLNGLEQGKVYTVRRIGFTPLRYCLAEPITRPVLSLWLKEIRRGSGIRTRDGKAVIASELGYRATRFRLMHWSAHQASNAAMPHRRR